MSLLEVSDLTAGYDRVPAISDVALRVELGEVVAVLGPNGAGKTTLLRAASGEIRPYAGSVKLDGRELVGMRSHQVARAGVAHVLEGRHILASLTVEENLLLGGGHHPRDVVRSDLQAMYELFPVLYERRRHSGAHLSGGEQQMLAVARGLMARPRILYLDEPSLGMAPRVVELLVERLRAVIENMEMTVLLIEQTVWMARVLARRVYLMELGRIVRESEASELTSDALADVYLGSDTTSKGPDVG